MKTTEVLFCGSCVVLALTLIFCDASPAWRPQGRFGKRARLAPIPRVIETAASEEGGVSSLMEVPIERLYSVSDLNELKTKPWLCTISMVTGYPPCGKDVRKSSASPSLSSTSSTSRMKSLNALAEYLNL